jgi:carbon storage regulator
MTKSVQGRSTHLHKDEAMLVLSRKRAESIRISDEVTVTVLAIKGNKVRIGIEAPQAVTIQRGELCQFMTPQHLSGPLPAAAVAPV